MTRNTITCEFCGESTSVKHSEGLEACPNCEERFLDRQDHFGLHDLSEDRSDWILPVVIGSFCAIGFIVAVVFVSRLQSVEERSVPNATVQENETVEPLLAENDSSLSSTPSSLNSKTSMPTRRNLSSFPNVLPTSDSASARTLGESGGKNLEAIYSFADGDQYQFQYEVTAEHVSSTEIVKGACIYNVLARDQTRSEIDQDEEGSGTAFVVSPDGLLVTCTHVIENATEITIDIGGKSYVAEVLEADEISDLAILKIQAGKLPRISLADSDAIQLGQDVRVVGFPLSRMLGTDVKATRGTISGIVQKDGQRQLQIDAAVNPGNSGGPVVNSYGEVVGIASAKLNGIDVSRIGFCVPANLARSLAESTGAKLPKSTLTETLTGPELVAVVSPAVAYVRVKSGPQLRDDFTELNFSGNFRSTHRNSRGMIMPTFRFGPGPGFGRGTLQLSHSGEILQTDDEVQLPYLLGPPSQLPFVHLPSGDRTSWTVRRQTSLTQEKPRTTASGIPLPRIRRPFAGRDNVEIVKVLPAIETIKYEITKSTEKEIVVTEDYEFRTTQADEGKITRLIGEGTITIDREKGFPSGYEFTGKYLVESDQVTAKVPIQVRGTLQKVEDNQVEQSPLARVTKPASPPDHRDTVNAMGTAPKLEFPVHQKIDEMGWGIKSLAFHPNGKFIAAGKADDFVEIYSVETGAKIFSSERLRELGNISSIAFSPDGTHLLAGGFQGVIKVWGCSEEGRLTALGEFTGHSRQVSLLAVTPNGEWVFSGGSAKQIRCWNLKTRQEEFSLEPFESTKLGIHFLDEDQAFVSDGLSLRLVNTKNGESIKTLTLRRSGSVNNVFFSPDGEVVAITDGYSLKRWNSSDGEPLPELKGKEVLWEAAYTPDGNTIICGGRGHLVFWNVETQKRDGHLLLGDSIMYVRPLTLTPDGRFLACYPTAAGQSLWIFDLKTN